MQKRVPFHQQLQAERQKRGLSQKEVASHIGCDPKAVGRWERNEGLPQPLYRRKLCELFAKSLEEFGLVEDRVEETNVVLPPRPTDQPLPSPQPAQTVSQVPGERRREDWGGMSSSDSFRGRDEECAQIEQWIVHHHCHVVTVLGVGGIGKTTFSIVVAERVKHAFGSVFWRSLQDAPPFDHLLEQCLSFLADQQHGPLPKSRDEQITLLLRYLRDRPCLIILDNVESILQAERPAGHYREGYESYGRLIQRIGETQHQSCLLLTSREKPKEVAHMEGKTSPVRSLVLPSVGLDAGRAILQEKEVLGTDEEWAALIHRYSGNPLALKMVAGSIQELFGGEIASFLEEGTSAFGDIDDLLEHQFRRLSAQEHELLYWLAIEREAVAVKDIREDLVQSTQQGALLEALQSLRRRSLLEVRDTDHFTLQPVIMEYVTSRLIKRACEELATGTRSIWANYAFMKAQVKDYVRESQIRLILAPIGQFMLLSFGRDGIKQRLEQLLSTQRMEHPYQPNYLAANALHLVLHLQCNLRGFDFSHLVFRQAYLQHAILPEVNFAHAHFDASTFTSTFGNVLSVTYSRDGNVLAAGTSTGDIWVYQAATEKLLSICSGHADGVWSVAFDADGNTLASSSDDQTVRLWDSRSGQCLKTLRDHTNRVRAVAFSPDGSLFASGSDDQTVRLWDSNSGEGLKVLEGHTDRIWSVAFSPDGNLLATGGTDTLIRLWDVHTGESLKVLQGHTHAVRSLAFSPDGSVLSSAGDDQTVRLWTISTGQCLTLQGHTNRVWSVAWSPNGELLASGSEDQTIRVWTVNTGRCLRIHQGHTQGVRSVTFSPDSSTLTSGGDDQTVRKWDIRTGDCLKTLQGYTNRAWCVSFGPDDSTLISGNEDQFIHLWDVHSARCFKTLRERGHSFRTIALSPNGELLASGGEDETVRVWDMKAGSCLKTLRGHTNWVRSVAFSPTGALLASGGEDQTVWVWHVATGNCLRTLQEHTNWIRSIAFSPTGALLASAGDDRTIRLWNPSTGHCLRVLQGHTGRVRSIAFSPNGELLASGSEDQHIHLWNVSTGECLKTLQGHTNRVLSVAFGNTGELLASGGDDQTLRIWDVRTGHCLKVLLGHTNRIRQVVFDHGGQTLVSSSDDGTLKLWNRETGACIETFISERPYEQMNISHITGLTEAQKTSLRKLGAFEKAGLSSPREA